MINQILPAHEFSYGDAQVNVYHANKGDGLQKHSHDYSHATVCHSGKCLVSLDGRKYVIDKLSQPLNLPDNQWHEIKALEDNTVFVNIFAKGKY